MFILCFEARVSKRDGDTLPKYSIKGLLVNIVPSWDVKRRELARVF